MRYPFIADYLSIIAKYSSFIIFITSYIYSKLQYILGTD